MNSKVPSTWTIANLGDCAEVITKGTTPTTLGFPFEAAGIPFVKVENLANGFVNGASISAFISEDANLKLRRSQLRENDLLFSIAGTIGRTAIVRSLDLPANTNQAVAIIRGSDAVICPAYLRLYLGSNLAGIQAAENARGGAMNNISLADVRAIEVPIAPWNEQLRIVAAVDVLLTELDHAVASLIRVQANIKRYRAAVLKAACEGRLVPTEAELARKEGRAYEDGGELLKRILIERRAKWEADQLAKMMAAGNSPKNEDWKEKYKEPEPLNSTSLPQLPKGWTWARVSQVGFVQLGRQRAPQHHSGQYMRPYLRVANVFEDRIDVSDVLNMNFTPEEFRTYELSHGDILLNEGQSLDLIGRPAIYRGEVEGCCFQNTLVRFRAVEGVLSEYALLVFLSYLHNQRFQKIAKWTTNIAHLGAERFAQLEFPLPPLQEQERILAEWKLRSTILAHSTREMTLAIKRANSLRQSILRRAFEGNLVLQDPIDEPASVLLERIRAARTKSNEPIHRRKQATVIHA